MKKLFAIVLTLALALSMAVMASADAAEDLKKVIEDLTSTVEPEVLKEAWDEVWAEISATFDLPKDAEDLDAGDMSEEVADATTQALIEKLGLDGTDLAAQIQGSMSNDFISFLAGLYTGGNVITTTEAPETEEETTTTAKITNPPKTGDASTATIALATFAALSAVGAAAFVSMKKKEA